MLLPKRCALFRVRLSETNSFYVIDFDTVQPYEMEQFPLPFVMHMAHGSDIRRAFERITTIWSGLEPGKLLQCRAKIYALLDTLLQLNENSAYHIDLAFINEAVAFIHENYMQPELYIGQIAERISESQLRRLFRKFFICPRMSTCLTFAWHMQGSALQPHSERGGLRVLRYYFCRVQAADRLISHSAGYHNGAKFCHHVIFIIFLRISSLGSVQFL